VGVVGELRQAAAGLPGDGEPVVQRARARALVAVETVADAVGTDPTLPCPDRCRFDFDVLAEVLRQLRPLARQAAVELQRRRLTAAGPADAKEVARLGRTNPLAPDELDALSQRAVEVADRIAAAAWPDWNTPRRILERSTSLLPSPWYLEEIADRLRHAVEASMALPYPAPEAVRLAALADQITITTPRRRRCRCAGPGCDRELEASPTGRPRRYCGATCRQRARRLTRTASPTA
jgi:hypothetical protein